MDRWDASCLAKQLMSKHGLAGWRFGFNRRKRTLGLCRYEEQRIELSLHFVAGNSESAVRDTILHEIAHALAGAQAGHGPRWKRVCQRLGARPERCDRQATMPKGPWRATCRSCGREHARYRRPLTGRTYFCLHCGPRAGLIEFQHRSLATR
jgi:predicted SprT family Zn-dependent metalloprotease